MSPITAYSRPYGTCYYISMRHFRIFLFIIVSVFAIWWFGRPLAEMARRVERIDVLRAEVEELAVQKEELAGQVAYYRSDTYVEQEARDRLNLSREGERVVIVPDTLMPVSEEVLGVMDEHRPPWKQWRDLFLE